MPDWLDISIFGITQIFMLVGLLGLIIPVYPGTVIMWLAALGYGVVSGFSTWGTVLFVIITLLMLVSTVVDNLFLGAGARKGGASWTTILIALVAGVVFTLIFPPIGGLIAAPLAVLLLEYQRTRDFQLAWASLRGMATGFGLSILARMGIGLLMMILWWMWVGVG